MKIMRTPIFISSEYYYEAEKVSEMYKKIIKSTGIEEIDLKEYTDIIDSVGIIINCFPDDYIQAGWGKLRKYISYKNRYADIRLAIPYNEFMEADDEKKYLMVLDNIIYSIKVIGERCQKSKRARFDSQELITEILSRLNISEEQLKDVHGTMED